MADPYQLLERDTRETESALDLADHNRTWAQTFRSTPPTDVLRANRNYDDLLSNAIDQRSQIRARTDPEAQKMMFQERLQPLREELLQSQIEHQAASTLAAGAAQRYKTQQDMTAMQDQVHFLHHMEDAPPPGTPEYKKHVLVGIDKFPHVLTTQFGKELLTNIGQTNDTIESLKSQIPPEFQVKSITAGGGKQSHVTAERIGPDEGDLATELKTGYGLTPGQVKNPVAVQVGNLDESGTFKGDHKGGLVKITTGKGETVQMSVPEYLRFGGKFSAETEAARAPAKQTAIPNISQTDYDKLKPGEPYHWNGKTLTKK